MEQTKRRHSFFELFFVVALVLFASWPAASVTLAGSLALFHSLVLITGYLLVRLLLGRINKWMGKLIFSVTALLLLADILIQQVTGLHLNTFVFSVMLQPGITEELGISGLAAYGSIVALLAVGLVAAKKLKEPSFELKGRILLVICLIAVSASQLLYGSLFFRGESAIEETRRKLPFFAAPHPYYNDRFFSFFAPKSSANPFSLSGTKPIFDTPPREHKAFTAPKQNVLIIIADSIRSKDIAADPTLTPNLFRWAKEGSLSFDHYSVSNCTHFSFYSMFTGLLPTEFGTARRTVGALGILPQYAANGYRVSSAEANSLDWYDTASIIFPANTQRYVSTQKGAKARDMDVTIQTINTLDQNRSEDAPYFHIAYYFSSHYPYDSAFSGKTETSYQQYKRTIKAFDDELGKLLTWAEENKVLDDTIVIITSDHGEEFEATGRTGHATRLSDEQLKIPFLIVNQTKGHQRLKGGPATHLDLGPYLLANANGATSYQPQPTILAACGYDHPEGYAIISGDERVDFSHRDGYLTPIHSPDGSLPGPSKQLDAAATLIKLIKKGPPEAP